jgi:hypothetical protein
MTVRDLEQIEAHLPETELNPREISPVRCIVRLAKKPDYGPIEVRMPQLKTQAMQT